MKLPFVDKASKAVVAFCTKCVDKIKGLFKKKEEEDEPAPSKESEEPKTEDTTDGEQYYKSDRYFINSKREVSPSRHFRFFITDTVNLNYTTKPL